MESFLEKHHPFENVELEVRLGRIVMGGHPGKHTFVAGVTHVQFDTILRRLQSNRKWTRVNVSSFVDYMYEEGIRVRLYEDAGRQDICRKHKLDVLDMPMKGSPLDLRICVSSEQPYDRMPLSQKPSSVYKKTRHSFVHKDMWSFDVTLVEAVRPESIDDDRTFLYHVELELIDPKKAKSVKYMSEYIRLLSNDLLGMVTSI